MLNKLVPAVMIHGMDDASRLISYSTKYIIKSDTNDALSFLPGVKYVPAEGDRIWFHPGCDIPRFKVKRFCQDNNVAVVKYKEKSTVRFIGPDSIQELIFSYQGNSMHKDSFLAWLDTVMCNAYLQLKEDILKAKSDRVYLGAALGRFCNEDMFGKKILDKTDTSYGYANYVKDDSSYQQIVDMCADPNLKSQDDLLALLNTGTEMDEKMYNDIHRLFESTDKENTRLAMEAMANCDFQKSAVYLLLLVKKYGNKISNSGNVHHVNFKSLIKYFQIKSLDNISVDDMINSLRHQKLLSVDNLNRLMPLAMQTIRETGDLDNIKIKDVELSPEAEQSIAENILDQQTTLAPVAPENPEPHNLDKI